MTFWRSAKKTNKLIWHFKFFVNKDHMRLNILKRYPYGFHPMSAKVYEDIRYHTEIQVMLLFLAITRSNIFCQWTTGGKVP